jgi:hypothetical protein
MTLRRDTKVGPLTTRERERMRQHLVDHLFTEAEAVCVGCLSRQSPER